MGEVGDSWLDWKARYLMENPLEPGPGRVIVTRLGRVYTVREGPPAAESFAASLQVERYTAEGTFG